MTGQPRSALRDPSPPRTSAERIGRLLLLVVAVAVLAVLLPAVISAAPLSDDYHFCLRGADGEALTDYVAEAWPDTGVVRPARFVTWLLVAGGCPRLPFWMLTLVPLALKAVATVLLLALLRDLRLPAPWPHLGAAIWLLEPLGTEAALWPSAMHVHLGLVFALAALLAYRRGALVVAGIVSLLAFLSVEQTIFAMPLAAAMVSTPDRRRRAVAVAGTVAITVLVAYAVWPGTNPRQAVSLVERLGNVVTDPMWFVSFPAVGLGLHSGAMALLWLFPWSVGAVLLGALLGGQFAPAMLMRSGPPLERSAWWRWLGASAALVLLVTLPLIVTETGHSARTFTPVWLALSALAAVGGSRMVWRRVRLAGAAAVAAASVALLSLALSVSVRTTTVVFNEASAEWLATRVGEGDVVAICGVPRAVVPRAPAGSFHLHAWHTESPGALRWHTGVRAAEWRRSGQQLWGSHCPDTAGADVVIEFDDLLRATQPS